MKEQKTMNEFILLEGIEGEFKGQTIEVKKGSNLLFGTGPNCHVRFKDPTISREHCQIELSMSNGWFISQSAPTVGTFLSLASYFQIQNQAASNIHYIQNGMKFKVSEYIFSAQIKFQGV